MSWYFEGDGTIIVCPDADQRKTHIGFQMGTILRHDGKLVLTDMDLLWMCGKKTTEKKWEQEHSHAEEDEGEITVAGYITKALKSANRNRMSFACPMDKKKCRFWNNVFYVCSIARKWKKKVEEKCPCVTKIEEAEAIEDGK